MPRRSVSQAEPSFYERSPEESREGSHGPRPNALGRGSRIGGAKWLNSTPRSLSSRESTSVVAWAIRPETKPSIFIDARRAAGGSIAVTDLNQVFDHEGPQPHPAEDWRQQNLVAR
jgi:hypothetical protein